MVSWRDNENGGGKCDRWLDGICINYEYKFFFLETVSFIDEKHVMVLCENHWTYLFSARKYNNVKIITKEEYDKYKLLK